MEVLVPTYRAKVDENGAMTLPQELRDRLGIVAGMPVEFFLAHDGQVHFHAITETAWGWRNLFEKRVPPLSIREMDDAIVESVSEDDERIKSYGVAKTQGRAAE